MNEMTNDPSGMTRPALDAVRSYLATVRAACLLAVAPAGKPDLALLQAEQRRLHGFAWAATTVEAMEQLARWGMGKAAGERLVVQIGLGEYLAQLIGGLPMGQNEIVRPVDLGTEDAADTLAHDPAVCAVLRGNTPAA
ncbi:MAG: hypothetical protein ACRYG8_25435, partial [Janthinobacterium lividum]